MEYSSVNHKITFEEEKVFINGAFLFMKGV